MGCLWEGPGADVAALPLPCLDPDNTTSSAIEQGHPDSDQVTTGRLLRNHSPHSTPTWPLHTPCP